MAVHAQTLGRIYASDADAGSCVTKQNESKLAIFILSEPIGRCPTTHTRLERTELNYLREPSQLPPISLGHEGLTQLPNSLALNFEHTARVSHLEPVLVHDQLSARLGHRDQSTRTRESSSPG